MGMITLKSHRLRKVVLNTADLDELPNGTRVKTYLTTLEIIDNNGEILEKSFDKFYRVRGKELSGSELHWRAMRYVYDWIFLEDDYIEIT